MNQIWRLRNDRHTKAFIRFCRRCGDKVEVSIAKMNGLDTKDPELEEVNVEVKRKG